MNTGHRARLIAAVSAPVLALLLATPARAQAKPEAAADAGKDGIQEIVVTATRVETSAQKTAIALTVYSGADLTAKGVTNVIALQAIDPSVNISTSTGSAYVAVRGIASTDLTEIGDPAVPIARDGFYTNRSYGIQSTMFDVARVEVLKGPQGTLQGRNSTGGQISVITNRPTTDRDSGYMTSTIGNYGAFHEEAGLNLKLTDTLAIRASGVYDHHTGYRTITGLYTGAVEKGDDSNTGSGRIQILWKPSPGLQFWASYQHDSITGVGDVALNTPLGVAPTSFGDGKNFTNYAPTLVNLAGDRIRWEARYDNLPGGFRFIYSGGYDVEDYHHALDATGAGPNAYPAYQQFIQHEHPKTWNHEARISNDVNSTLFVQAGWFHFQEMNALTSGIYDDVMVGPFAQGGPLAGLSQAGNFGILFQYPAVYSRSDALFGYLASKLGDTVKLSAGVRNTWDHKTRIGTATIDLAALASPFIPSFANPPPTPGNGDVAEHKATFHLGLDFTPTPRNLIYAKFDTGYKPGGFNSNGSAPSVPYGPETVSTFEIGSKNRLLGNRLELNVDGFYSDYRGYQASQFTPALSGAAGVQNIGSAKIYGAEAQVVALLGVGGRFDLNAAVLHTQFGQGLSVVNGTTGQSVDISGNKLPNSPGLSFTTGLQQDVGMLGGTLTGRIEGKYSSSFYYSIFNNPNAAGPAATPDVYSGADTRSGAYMTGNVSLTYKPAKGNWSVQAYVRNFTDKLVLAHAEENSNANANNYEFQPPRTFGITGNVKF